MKTIVRFIEGKLGLVVNAEKSEVSRPKELKFLGFGYYYDFKTERYQVKPHKNQYRNFKESYDNLQKKWNRLSRFQNS